MIKRAIPLLGSTPTISTTFASRIDMTVYLFQLREVGRFQPLLAVSLSRLRTPVFLYLQQPHLGFPQEETLSPDSWSGERSPTTCIRYSLCCHWSRVSRCQVGHEYHRSS